MKLQDVSEIVAGMVFQGKIPAKNVHYTKLIPPFDMIVGLKSAGETNASILDKVGLEILRIAEEAANRVTSTEIGDDTWIDLLDKAYARDQLASELEKYCKKLKLGGDIDYGNLLSTVRGYSTNRGKYVTLDTVEGEAGTWVDTGYVPLDLHTGGLPDASLTIVGATTSVGKTALTMKLIGLRAIRGEKSLMYSLEMINKQIKWRLLQMMSLSPTQFANIISCDRKGLDVDDIYSDACRLASEHKLGMICIDFADLLATSEQSEQVTAHIYYTCANLAQATEVPVVLVAQLNRAVYDGGRPRMFNIRYSGMAEAAAAQVLLLYRPTHSDSKTDELLKPVTGRGYIIQEKARFGFKEGGPGAMMVDWDGRESWGDTSYGWINF